MWLALSACSSPEGDLPETYRELRVAEARLASAEARQRGRAIFLEHCAICHGVDADGNGVRRPSLSSPPADLTRADWRARTTPRRAFAVIREGRRGTPMAAWPGLSDDEVWDVVAYLFSRGKG